MSWVLHHRLRSLMERVCSPYFQVSMSCSRLGMNMARAIIEPFPPIPCSRDRDFFCSSLVSSFPRPTSLFCSITSVSSTFFSECFTFVPFRVRASRGHGWIPGGGSKKCDNQSTYQSNVCLYRYPVSRPRTPTNARRQPETRVPEANQGI